MIPNHSVVADVESTLQGKRVHMRFTNDPQKLAAMMQLLAGVYTKPTLAVAREYTTNAIDSHIEAGQTRPVEITLPNVYQPNLIIQDFGIGMDAQDIEDIYCAYGESTKNTSNKYNGMMGIGSKAAFAYSGTFTVEGVKNGVKTVVSVGRDRHGAGVQDIIATFETDEPNGVKIQIPVSKRYEMEAAVHEVCRYLPAGLVLVNGKDISEREKWILVESNITDADGNVVVKNLWHDINGDRRSSRILMNNGAYEFTEKHFAEDKLVHEATLIAEVADAAVVFAPTRERLMDVDLSRDVERLIVDFYNKRVAKSMLESVHNAASKWEAVQKYHAVKGVLSVAGYPEVKYKGEVIPPVSTPVVPRSAKWDKVAWVWNPNRSRHSLSHEWSLEFNSFYSGRHVVINHPANTPTTSFRNKARHYFNNDSKSIIIIPEGTVMQNTEWMDTFDFVDYKDIKAVQLPRVPRTNLGGGAGSGISTKGKHFVADSIGSYTLREIQDDEKILFFVKSDVEANWNFGRILGHGAVFSDISRSLVKTLKDKEILVHVYGNRVDRLMKDYPDAQRLTFVAAHDRLLQHAIKNVTVEDLRARASQDVFRYDVKVLSCIPDDDKDKVCASYMEDVQAVRKGSDVLTILPANHEFINKFNEYSTKFTEARTRMRDRYPLWDYANRTYDKIDFSRYFELDYNNSVGGKK